MVLDFVYPAPECGEPENRPAIVYKVHYTYFGQMSIIITSLAIVIISLLTEAPDRKSALHMTWWTRYKPDNVDATMIEVIDNKQSDTPNGVQEMEELPDDNNAETNGRLRRWVDIVCGIPKESGQPVSLEEEAVLKKEFLTESKFWKRFLNANAALGLVVLAFIIGFFR